MVVSGDTGHSVTPGKTLIEKIRDQLDEAYAKRDEIQYTSNWSKENEAALHGICVGIARALGTLRSTSQKAELQAAEERWANRGERNASSSVDGQ